MASLEIFASEDFRKIFDSADIKLQCLVRSSLRDMVNRFQSNPGRVWTQYQRFEGFGEAAKRNGLISVIEIEVAKGVRLLAGVSSSFVYLFDLGQHDIERQWDRIQDKANWLGLRKRKSRTANNLLSYDSNPFISLSECEGWSKHFESEDTSEWVRFLDIHQYEIVDRVTNEIENHLLGNKNRDLIWLILGGPGTGKTVVLLKILQKMLCYKVKVGFSCSDAVLGYLQSATGCIIPRWEKTCCVSHMKGAQEIIEVRNNDTPYDVLLFDDPESLEELEKNNRPSRVIGQGPRALVYAFDPLQLVQMPTNEEFSKAIERTKATVYELKTCYRQRERLAEKVSNMTDVLAGSSPFLRQDKIADFAANYSDLLSHFNKPEYVYPLGEYKIYHTGSLEVIKERIVELGKLGTWTHSPSFLFVIDRELKSVPLFDELINKLNDGKLCKSIWSNQVKDVKGVDFKHVLVILSKETLEALQQPFQGSGRPKFNDRRMMRIPFSRARDSLSLFVWKTN